ncbi:peptide-methionine (S)-S-oxide reductase [Dyadobacter sp.]|uniref:peptide-methionine (S)-S-oxide reductase n=1 Tax=Dyadobacter sp. TaxID=1914288 RepID=UPI003F70841C
MITTDKIGFGGSCHWCTEAIFKSLKGIIHVAQGWIRSVDDSTDFSEAVIVEFDPSLVSLENVIGIHLHTHSCTSQHSMRSKYRSAVYIFRSEQEELSRSTISQVQADFDQPIITEVIPFGSFKLNKDEYLDYYYKDPEKPFCKTFIDPKLKLLLDQFADHVNEQRLH